MYHLFARFSHFNYLKSLTLPLQPAINVPNLNISEETKKKAKPSSFAFFL